MQRISLILCALSLALGLATAGAADVTATLEPTQVAVGETAQLTITINGSDSGAPSLPNIPGLEIAHVGQSTQIEVINGSMTSSSIQTYEITPQHAGTFTIPSIKAGGGKSNPVTLRVTGSGGSAQSNANPQSSAGGATLPPPNVQMPPADTAAPAAARYGFIQMAVPKKDFYVGELVPVDVSAFIPAGLNPRINGLPTLDSQGFTLNQLGDKPEQTERIIGGHEYIVVTWHSALTAVKPGDFSLSMEMPATVVVREQAPPRRQRSGNDPFDQFFNDPFFDDAFASRGRPKEVTLTSEPAAVSVQALPAANRPADFAGAVGHFDVRASATPTSVAAGDPITLRLEVRGSGDFDRVSAPMLAGGNGWKTYPPKSTFQAADSANYKGSKTFEQVVIPQDDSVREIPEVRFSFFDPKTRQYETRTTPPMRVAVTGTPAPANLATAASAPTAGGSAAAAAADLVPNKVEPGGFVATLRPVFLDPWFVAAQGLPLCALAGGLLFVRRQRRFAADPRLARASAAERAIHAELARMDQAMRQRSSAEFFLSARGALQQRLGERWNVRPETITLAEITSRMNGAGEGIRPIFEMADQASYSGQNLGDADYRQWKEFVVAQLKALEKAS